MAETVGPAEPSLRFSTVVLLENGGGHPAPVKDGADMGLSYCAEKLDSHE